MTEPYTDTEKRDAKALKKLAEDEHGYRRWKHHECLNLVRKYAHHRKGHTREQFIAVIWDFETSEHP
jgi:hypothetical protein